MKTSRLRFNLITAALIVIFAVFLLAGNIFHATISVATVSGSYADTYADEKHLGKVELADNEKEYFDLRYEDFDYNVNDDGTLTLENYKGVSEDLVIPSSIGDMEVTRLGENFIKDAITVKNLYLSPIFISIESDPVDTVTIHCDDSSEFYILNEDSGWKIELMNDSDYVNFMLGDIPFRYNDLGDSIELVGYTGPEKAVIIPSYINGKPVTTVSFDMLGEYDMVVFPATVTAINGMTTITTVSGVFAFAVFFVVVALIANIIVMNIVLPRLKNLDEIVISSPAVIVTYLYLIIQIVYSLLAIYKGIGGLGQIFAVGIILLIAYIIFISMAGRGHRQAKQVKEHIAENTSKMRNIKDEIKGLSDGISDSELKKRVKRVEEDIRYMSLNTRDADKEEKLLKLIYETRENIALGDTAKIEDSIIEIEKIIK